MKKCIKYFPNSHKSSKYRIEKQNKQISSAPLLNYEYSGKCFDNQDGESYLAWK